MMSMNNDILFPAIENLYCGEINLNKDKSDEIIFEPHLFEINKTVIDKSRYNGTPISEWIPYKINKDCMVRLFMKMMLLPYSGNKRISTSSQLQSLVVDSTTDKLYLYDVDLTSFNKDLIFRNCITPLGLYAIRLRSFFKNSEFKQKVEDYLSSCYRVIHKNGIKFFVDNSIYPSYIAMTIDKDRIAFLQLLLETGLVFSWRDKQ